MAYFKLKVYHGGFFTYRNGPLEYVGGETTMIEEIDGDRWSVFEAYAELKQFGYVEENIPSLWFKDPTHEDLEKNLKLFKSDADSIAMCKIAEVRDYVELYVVHKVEEEQVFPACGYIDVGGGHRMDDVGQQLVVYGGEDVGSKKSDVAADISGAENTEGGDDANLDANMEYEPSEEEEETEDDLHFTSSEDELDPDFEDEDGAGSDEVEDDHEVGGLGSDSDHQGQSYPVHKHQKDMSQYKWEVGTVYATREEFKDTVTAYAVQRARAITFRKCDLQRVRAVCTGKCPFWLYAAKMKEEDSWQLRSMNLTHTCTQTHRVGILHSRWLGKAFKKKVESNPRVKIRELVSKAQKKWNLTVTKSMATRTKQIALDEIQGTFREQYKRIYDYAHELMRANPGTSVRLQVQRYPEVENEVASSQTSCCIFQRIYICLEACKQSFNHCRSFIGLDGCFLKTPQGGQLLTAIGWDPNDQMLPVAYAVVEAETKDSWTWFLSHLATDIGVEKMGRTTFMSDQQKVSNPKPNLTYVH
ncbi:hypothetical protein Ahy_B04g070798 isoform A [Arachis hypogaea]|uniref:Transposase MuDR plant domain-containing protein n=1 Tax=Arachis hypogaea TaxID=3818 RepID=A0A444ZJ41_ARAHY|nr:hypothetical protein Ahy_B04g070798 isoform A [Arachis hypogaea]